MDAQMTERQRVACPRCAQELPFYPEHTDFTPPPDAREAVWDWYGDPRFRACINDYDN